MRTCAGARLTLLVSALALGSLARAAEGAPPTRHEGKTLEDWIKQTSSKSEERARDAIYALERARFLVEAKDQVVPLLLSRLTDASGVDFYAVVGALGRYGFLASQAEPQLEKLARDDSTSSILIARLLIGRDVKGLVEEYDRRVAEKRETFRLKETLANGMRLGDMIRYSGKLGLRAESVVRTARELMSEELAGAVVRSDVLDAAMSWGMIAAPVSGTIPPFLADKEPVTRGRAAIALAQLRNLNAEQEAGLFRVAKGLASGYFALGITKGIALTLEHDAKESLALLRGRASSGDPAVAAWAVAGLARRVVGDERAKLLPMIEQLLKHENPEARTGAADAILVLRDLAQPMLPSLRIALADADLRVRWRAAAVLLKYEDPTPALLAELTRGIDGPEDLERMAAFNAVYDLGSRAKGLADRIQPWAAVPFPLLAATAARALEAAK